MQSQWAGGQSAGRVWLSPQSGKSARYGIIMGKLVTRYKLYGGIQEMFLQSVWESLHSTD